MNGLRWAMVPVRTAPVFRTTPPRGQGAMKRCADTERDSCAARLSKPSRWLWIVDGPLDVGEYNFTNFTMVASNAVVVDVAELVYYIEDRFDKDGAFLVRELLATLALRRQPISTLRHAILRQHFTYTPDHISQSSRHCTLRCFTLRRISFNTTRFDFGTYISGADVGRLACDLLTFEYKCAARQKTTGRCCAAGSAPSRRPAEFDGSTPSRTNFPFPGAHRACALQCNLDV